MKTWVRTADLQVGMYIELPVAWWAHPFARSHFLVDSPRLLKQVQEFHRGQVLVDIDRSRLGGADGAQDGEPSALFSDVSREIAQAIHRRDLPRVQRARALYGASRQVVVGVMDDPTSANIRAAKEAVGQVVDAIIADPGITGSLLAVSNYDTSTYTHVVNVGVYAIALATSLYAKSPDHNLRELGAALFLHDIGKTRIPLDILNKQGRLSPDEMAVMRTHPLLGDEILEQTGSATVECRVIALQHHERVDGTGYPHGLRGDDIHEYGRMCSIADVFDALVSKRSYKDSMTPYAALGIMRDQMLGHFQREMFERFVCLFAQKRAA